MFLLLIQSPGGVKPMVQQKLMDEAQELDLPSTSKRCRQRSWCSLKRLDKRIPVKYRDKTRFYTDFIMKRNKEDMEIVWQTPANPPEHHDYIFRNRIRYVKPYYFEFISHAKNRWAGRPSLICLLKSSKDSAVKSGCIQVDGKTAPGS